MNKRGQTTIAIITALIILIVGMLVVNILKPEITTARSVSNLDCGNSTISDGTKLTCLAVDATLPYYIIIIVAAVGALIAGRFMGLGKGVT